MTHDAWCTVVVRGETWVYGEGVDVGERAAGTRLIPLPANVLQGEVSARVRRPRDILRRR